MELFVERVNFRSKVFFLGLSLSVGIHDAFQGLLEFDFGLF